MFNDPNVLYAEVKGSLFAFFKEKAWATSLLAYVADSGCGSTSLGRLCIISMNLTNFGLEKVNKNFCFINLFYVLLC